MTHDPNLETSRLRERLETLGAISRTLGAAETLEELCRMVHGELSRLLDVTGLILALYDEPSQLVTVAYQIDSGVELPGGSFPLGKGFTSQVIRNRSPLLIRHWTREGPRVQIRYATDKKTLPESALVVPLLLGGQVLGALSLQSYQTEAYDDEDLLTVQVIANQLAVTIQNLRISQRLDAQLQRRVSELEVILENMADALFIVDARGCIVRLNRAARELLCTDDNSLLLGRPLDGEHWEQLPPEAQAVARALTPILEALREGQELRDLEMTVQGRGRQILSFSCTPLHDLDGTLAGGVVVFRDVTSRRDIERLKDEVLSIASHDLKGPLTVIKGQLQLLRRQYARSEIDHERVERGWSAIERECNQMVAMMDLLLDFSRIEAGRLRLQRTPTDLVPMAERVIEGTQATTDRHLFLLNAPPSVVGKWDARRLEQVLRNLVLNAVKYSPEGGTVEISIESSGGRATVSIRDEGMGLASEELPYIFERFYRAAESRRLEGTGLGLYICHQIVASHGGTIWAESAGPGQGSTFRFTLPHVIKPAS